MPTHTGPSTEDIAVGLGRQSRFAGQTREFYTVLCHSLTCAKAADKFHPGWPELKRLLLLHDGHESVISDVPTTWKNALTRDDEAELDRRIFAEHGIINISSVTMNAMKQVDAAALAAEAHALGHLEAEKWWPKANFDDLASYIFDQTILHLQVGNPVHFLNPDNAIPAFRSALESCG